MLCKHAHWGIYNLRIWQPCECYFLGLAYIQNHQRLTILHPVGQGMGIDSGY
jgi:hypothetical protein